MAQERSGRRRGAPLPAGEERALALRFRLGQRARRRLAAPLPLPAELRRRLLSLVERGDRAGAELVRASGGLVASLARPFLGLGLPASDLIQEGTIGLIEALRRFDPGRGYRLCTYASCWIRQAVARAACEQAHLVRLPAHKRRELARLWRGVARIRAALEREPSVEEIARALALAEDRVRALFALPRRAVSLDRPPGGDGGRPAGPLLPDPTAPTPADEALRDLAAQRLGRALSSLPEREQLILRLRFGLEDGEPRTFREIGVRLGLTPARARQLVVRALDRMRHPSRRALLDGLQPGL